MEFTLHWIGGKTSKVRGDDIADACRKAGIGNGALAALDFYEEGSTKIDVAGQAACGCVYHAEECRPCPHDLQRVGLHA